MPLHCRVAGLIRPDKLVLDTYPLTLARSAQPNHSPRIHISMNHHTLALYLNDTSDLVRAKIVTVVNQHKFKGKDWYRRWLRKQWKGGGIVKRELLRLVALAKVGDLNLVCSCKPHPCHGDVLKEAIEALINKGY